MGVGREGREGRGGGGQEGREGREREGCIAHHPHVHTTVDSSLQVGVGGWEGREGGEKRGTGKGRAGAARVGGRGLLRGVLGGIGRVVQAEMQRPPLVCMQHVIPNLQRLLLMCVCLAAACPAPPCCPTGC